MTLWDIAAGILLAFGVIGMILYGVRNHDRGLFIGGLVFMAVIVCWRLAIWHGDIDRGAPERAYIAANSGQ